MFHLENMALPVAQNKLAILPTLCETQKQLCDLQNVSRASDDIGVSS